MKLKSDESNTCDDVQFICHYQHTIDVLNEADDSTFTFDAKAFGIKRLAFDFDQTAEFKSTKFPAIDYFASQHLHELSVASDGNCFLRAVSLFIFGTQSHHLAVRQACSEELRSNAAYYSSLTTDKEEDLVDRAMSISKPKVWASDVEIRVVCQLLKCDIFTYTEQAGAMTWVRFKQQRENRGKPSKRKIFLHHKNNNHYNLLCPVIFI
jgi:hypothetical protein